MLLNYYSFTFFVLLHFSKIEKVNNKHSIEIYFIQFFILFIFFFSLQCSDNKSISSISFYSIIPIHEWREASRPSACHPS